MSSLLDSLEEQTSPDLIRGLASSMGESSDAVQKALLGGSAAVLATLASKAQEPGEDPRSRTAETKARSKRCRAGVAVAG